MMLVQHPGLASGGWRTLTLAEQLANVGSEVSRAASWQRKEPNYSSNAFDRALELLDLTIQDPRWCGRLKELTRLRELLCDAFFGGEKYGNQITDFSQYFMDFTLAARLKK